MTDTISLPTEDDIDLETVVSTIRPYTWLIVIVGILAGMLSFLYYSNQPKVYVSVAKFFMKDSRDGLISRPKVIGMEAFTVGGGSGEIGRVVDRIASRNFIAEIFKSGRLDEEIFFVEYEKGFLQTFKELVPGLRASPDESATDAMTVEERRMAAIRVFQQNVSVSLQRNDVINLSAYHPDSETAAKIANTVVEAYLAYLIEERQRDDDRQIGLIRNRLDDARKAFNEALENSRLFILEQNIQPREELANNSLQLTQFRNKLRQIEAVIDGVRFFQDRQASGDTTPVRVDELFEKYPTAFSTLESRFNWRADQSTVDLPPRAMLDSLSRSLSNEYTQLQRSIYILEATTEENAEDVGILADLDREVQVREALYEGLVNQFEAMDIGAVLKNEKGGEMIQTAVSSPAPISGGTVMYSAFAAVFAMLATLILCFFWAFSSGRVFSDSQVAKVVGAEPRAVNVAKAVGTRSGMLRGLAKRPTLVQNVELLNLGLSLSDAQFGTVSILGIPKTGVSRNLSVLFAGLMAGTDKRVGIVDLNNNASEGTRELLGGFDRQELAGNIDMLTWKSASAEAPGDAIPLEEALDQMAGTFDSLFMLCAPISRGVVRNNIALGRSDHVVLLVTKKKTTKTEINRALSIVRHFPGLSSDLVVA